MVIFIDYFGYETECFDAKEDTELQIILNYIYETRNLLVEKLKFIHNGRFISPEHYIPNNNTVHISIPVYGGKGGFGSMLRAIGAQIEKTTNREACRDLSGRRLRDINEEQRLKRWISKKAEREKEATERRKQKLERLRSTPKHDFHDANYDRERRDLTERIDDALTHGLKTATEKQKVTDIPKPKKPRLWLEDNIDEVQEQENKSLQNDETSSEDDDCLSHIQYENENSSDLKEEKKVELNENNQDISLSSENSESSVKQVKCISNNKEIEDNLSIKETKHILDNKRIINDPSIEETKSISDLKKIENDRSAHSSLSEEIKEEKNVKNLEGMLDLMSYHSIEELEALGLDRLKIALQVLGLKCGGTLQQRTERLWSVRGITPDKINPSLLAKPCRK